MLTDLAAAVRKSGLVVKELDGWRSNASAGGEDYRGVSIHHTGSYDDVFDTSSDESYARAMAFTGRPDLPPPLCNLALSAESVVFVCAAGNANGVGQAKATGPMPAFSDGNRHYIVIEAMNSGTQGWGKKGKDADGNEVTQYEGYVRLCAALCLHYGWSPAVIRAHYETSVTGKWDPGDPNGVNFHGSMVMDMDRFRADVARAMDTLEDPMAQYAEQLDRIERKVTDLAADEATRARELRRAVRQQAESIRAKLRAEGVQLDDVEADVDRLLELTDED